MNDKDLYKQKYQAQLNEWKADIDKLKAKAMGSKADVQLDMNKLVADLESKSKLATDKLAELQDASEEAWDSVKTGVESAWDTLKTSMHNGMSKFKS